MRPDGDRMLSCCTAAEKVAEAEEEAEEAERQQKKPGREVSFFCIDYPGLVDAAQLRISKLLQGLKDRIQDKCEAILDAVLHSEHMQLPLQHSRAEFALHKCFLQLILAKVGQFPHNQLCFACTPSVIRCPVCICSGAPSGALVEDVLAGLRTAVTY